MFTSGDSAERSLPPAFDRWAAMTIGHPINAAPIKGARFSLSIVRLYSGGLNLRPQIPCERCLKVTLCYGPNAEVFALCEQATRASQQSSYSSNSPALVSSAGRKPWLAQ